MTHKEIDVNQDPGRDGTMKQQAIKLLPDVINMAESDILKLQHNLETAIRVAVITEDTILVNHLLLPLPWSSFSPYTLAIYYDKSSLTYLHIYLHILPCLSLK